MSILSDTYQRQKAKDTTPTAIGVALCVAVSVLAAAQSLYFDVRAQNNYKASAELHGTLAILEMRAATKIDELNHLNGKLLELLARQEKQDARH